MNHKAFMLWVKVEFGLVVVAIAVVAAGWALGAWPGHPACFVPVAVLIAGEIARDNYILAQQRTGGRRDRGRQVGRKRGRGQR